MLTATATATVAARNEAMHLSQPDSLLPLIAVLQTLVAVDVIPSQENDNQREFHPLDIESLILWERTFLTIFHSGPYMK